MTKGSKAVYMTIEYAEKEKKPSIMAKLVEKKPHFVDE
jgi:hypothetical protein